MLADATWPDFDYPSAELAELAKNYRAMTEAAVIRYLDEHPEITKIFWRTGGRPFVMQALQRYDSKFVGNYTYLNNFDIMSKGAGLSVRRLAFDRGEDDRAHGVYRSSRGDGP